MTRPDTDNYRELFLRGTSLLDVRAPVEFGRGAFPGAINLPLMTDNEREQVGICYQQEGQAHAIELGQQLVSGASREERLSGWCQFARANPEGYVYCFRGGLRSRTVQLWMQDAGVEYPLVKGGYKAMRRFLIEALQWCVDRIPLVLIAGATGSGKTRVIEQLPHAIDLEGIARHRGSAFGQLLEAQPSQVDFENSLTVELLRLEALQPGSVVLEDEGKLIGRVAVPDDLRRKMQTAALLVIEESLASRIDVVLEDYVIDLAARYAGVYGDRGPRQHRDKLLADIERIKKRLGGERTGRVIKALQSAFDEQARSGETALHRVWIEILLAEYYDPMYQYQMDKREGAVLLRGSRDEVTAFAFAQARNGDKL